MSARLEELSSRIEAVLAGRVRRAVSHPRELTYEVAPVDLLDVCRVLRDEPSLKFEMLMDVCGVDYLHYGHDEWKTFESTETGFSRGVARGGGIVEVPQDSHEVFDPPLVDLPADAQGRHPRFAVVYHLLSISHNWRIRLRASCPDDGQPMMDSVTGIWSSADWFEREAFDLFGILFKGHPDLRRILTDYGFVGHPFRKDFPLIGNVEVRYDPAKARVVYQPVSIEPRTLVPKVIREDNRYDAALRDRPAGAPVPASPASAPQAAPAAASAVAPKGAP